MLFSLGLVPVTLTRVRKPESVPRGHLGLRHLHDVAPLAVESALLSGMSASALIGMGPVFAQRSGLSAAGTALFMSVTIVGGALLQWPIGHLSDTRDRRKILRAVSVVAALSALGVYLAIGYLLAAAYVLSFVYGGLRFSIYALSAAHMNDHLRPGEVLEATGGLLLVYGIGAAAGPALAGLFMNAFTPGTLLLFFSSILTVLSCYAVYWIRRSTDIPTEAQEPFVSMMRTTPAALEMYPQTEAQPELEEVPVYKEGAGRV
jgi:MFS family permease